MKRILDILSQYQSVDLTKPYVTNSEIFKMTTGANNQELHFLTFYLSFFFFSSIFLSTKTFVWMVKPHWYTAKDDKSRKQTLCDSYIMLHHLVMSTVGIWEIYQFGLSY